MEGSKGNTKGAVKQHQDWVTSFDRDLIKAAQHKTPISFETIEDELEIEGGIVIQVDQEFIKVRVQGEDVWFNKNHICRLRIPDAA